MATPFPHDQVRRIADRTVGDIRAGLKDYGPAFRQGRHEHDAASFDFVVAGAGEGRCGPGHIQSFAGCVEFFPAFTEHDFASAPTGIRTLHIAFPADALRHEGVRPGLHGQTLPAECFARPCLDALRALREPDDAGALDLDACVRELVALLAGHAAPRRASVHARRAAAVLLERVTETVNLSDLATDLGVSPGHLARAFRATHGTSVGQFQRALRLRRAASMLARPGREPIARIAASCGFADQAHLTNHFRKAFGVPPARYRALVGAT